MMRVFEALTAKGVLVAIHSEPRAADALAVLHLAGGGNAANGARTDASDQRPVLACIRTSVKRMTFRFGTYGRPEPVTVK
jgi:hypothetical protein